MKKTLRTAAAAFASALLLIGSLPVVAGAEAVTSGDYNYEVQGGDVVILRYLGEDEEIVIPAKLDGKAVTVIGSRAFEMNPDITSIEVPDGIKRIDDHAFAIDKDLETITLPLTVTEIGEEAFQQCESLKNVNFAGDESAWGSVKVADGNELFTAITPSYNAALTEQADDDSSSSEASSSEASSSEASSSEASSSEASSSEASSSEASSSEASSSEASSSETSSSETSSSETTSSSASSASETASSEAVPQGSGVNIPVVVGGILIGVALLDIIYYSFKKPKEQ